MSQFGRTILKKVEYVKFLNQPEDKNDLEDIRKATLKGKPIGKERFLEHIAKNTAKGKTSEG